MGTINNKLSYLSETKTIFKDNLNSLGAEITNVTTFRNYLNWLDTFYGEVSDKTDLSVNGLVGRTSQETTSISGGDEYDSPSPDYPQPINNLTGNVSYKITTQNEEQTFTIPLGNIELCKINTYEDKIYSNNGRFYLEKNINKVILDGSESSWVKSEISPTYITDRFRVTINDIKVIYNTLSDKFLTRTSGAQDKEEIYSTANHYFYISINRSRLATDDITGFKNWLSTHNTIVYYALATSITTEITSSNYPELYAALKEIQDYLTSYKINKGFILNYDEPNINY